MIDNKNTDRLEQLKGELLSGLSSEAEKLLMEESIDSGEIFKAFSTAWAQKHIKESHEAVETSEEKIKNYMNKKPYRRGGVQIDKEA